MRTMPQAILDDCISRIEKALKRFSPEQGRIARRNARHDLKLAIRGLQREVDYAYPLIKKERRVVQKTAWAKALARARARRKGSQKFKGLVEASSYNAAALTQARIQPKMFGQAFMVPEWALKMLRNKVPLPKIALCKKSLNERKLVLARIALANSGPGGPTV